VTDTASQIDEALRIPRSVDSIEAVKAAVIRSIKSLDRRAQIENTDYFNHSFAPDLVLSWPHVHNQNERFVYLRFNEHPEWIAEEVLGLAKRRAIVYGLRTTQREEKTPELETISVESNTLVTDPAGISELTEGSPTGITGFITRTIFQGGRGLLDQPSADALSANVNAGFVAAGQADRDITAGAVSIISNYFDRQHAARNLGFLKAIWRASGASALDFPANSAETDDPGDDAIEYLLDTDEIDDWGFWRAIGDGISLKRLSEISLPRGSFNLGHLVEANLDRLWARAMRVISDQRRLEDFDVEEGGLIWRITGALLALSGEHFTAFVAPTVGDLKQIKTDDPGDGIPVMEVRRRSQGIPIDSLEMTAGDRVITYGSQDRQDVSNDDQLDSLGAAMGSTVVRKGSVLIGGRRVELDFALRTATARTSGQPPMAELIGSALPLIWPLSSDELERLNAMVESSRTAPQFDMDFNQIEMISTSKDLQRAEGAGDGDSTDLPQ
jgi:hypothetical protein